MIIGIGTDILEQTRVAKVFKRHKSRFVNRILTVKEIEESQSRSDIVNYLSKQFSAKEAVSKALGVGIGRLSFQDIEILRNSKGKPIVSLSEDACKRFHNPKIHLSLSDSNNTILAFCVIEE